MTPPIIKRYIIAFEKYKWIGLASFGLVVIGGTVYTMQPDPPISYVGVSQLTYITPPVSFSKTGAELQIQGQELTESVLLSDKLLEKVGNKVKVSPQLIAKNIVIKLPTKDKFGKTTSTIIDLTFKDNDKNRINDVLQQLMTAMVELSGEINTSRLKAIIGKINERLPQVKKELQDAERKLEQYDRLQGPAILAAENGSLLNAISLSQNQQRQIQLTVAGIDAQIQSLESKLGLSVDQAYVASALSADLIITNLRSQIYQIESQVAVLKQDLRPEHPTMVQLNRQLQAAEALLQERAAEVLGGAGIAAPLQGDVSKIRTQSSLDPTRQALANQMVALQTQRETLVKQLSQQVEAERKLRIEYSLIPNKQLERSRLEQTVLLKKAVYDQIQAKLTDAKTAEAETVTSLAIASPPVVTIANEIKPKNVPMTLAIGSFLGLVIGGGVIFLLGNLEGIFKTKEDINNSFKEKDVPVLGELPLLPRNNLYIHEIPVILSLDSPYLEFYEKFRSNVRRVMEKNQKIVLITSVGSGEGKTICSYNLGIASARAGKRTLIIEMDLRSPSYCSSLNVTLDPGANIEPLHYYANLSDCICIVPEVENLYIIPSPGPLKQSPAIIESSEIKRLIEKVRERYDLIILDTSPLSLSNDPLLIQPYSDGIILVTRPNYTQETMLTETVDQLMEYELNILGGVINGIDITINTVNIVANMENNLENNITNYYEEIPIDLETIDSKTVEETTK